jgi:hypothetical protein
MVFLLENPSFEFLTCLLVQVDGGLIVDLRIRVGRAHSPSSWETPAYQVEPQGSVVRARFERPGNWPRISVEIVGTNLSQPRAGFETLPRLDVSQRLAKMAQASIIFLGCARNCEAKLGKSVAAVQRLRGLFGASEFHVFENDSTDRTSELLRQWEREGVLTLHSRQGLDAVMPKRTERLAYGRNLLVAAALARPQFQYICWVDMDGLIDESFDVGGFSSCFQFDEAWEAVFPVNTGYYYDIWALRHPVMWPDDYMVQMNTECDLALGNRSIVETAMKSRQIKAELMLGWLPVESAFGGMGIYKASACGNGRYVGVEEGREICEHVSFHRGLHGAGGRLYINPEFRIPCPKEHFVHGV